MTRRGRRGRPERADNRSGSMPSSGRATPRAASRGDLPTGPAGEPTHGRHGAGLGASEVGEGEPLATLLDEQWQGGRSGAIAGRGYHFQDVIGTWLAARTLGGQLMVEQIVPEGLEDLSCEGADAWHVQVKSRQARVGDFPAARAAGAVIDAWLRHRKRAAVQPQARLAVVFERPIAGTSLGSWGQPLQETLGPADGFRDALVRAGVARGLKADQVARVLREVCAIVVGWADAEAETARMLAQKTGLPVGAVLPVALALRAEVARYADANAATGWTTRVGLAAMPCG
jgi:hypothetical protein